MASRRVRRFLRSGRCDERGTALVEFAFVLPLLLALVLGIVDFGRALNYYIDQTQLAAEGARYLVVNRNPCNPPAPDTPPNIPECKDSGGNPGVPLLQYLKQSVETKEQADSVNGVTVCVEYPNGGTPTAGDPVKVTASLPFKWLFLFESAFSMNITGEATMRLETKPTLYTSGSCYK